MMADPAAVLRDVTAIFVTFNSSEVVARSVASVPADMPLIVFDNASRDDTLAIVRAERPDALVIANSENIGYGPALNRAVQEAATDFVFMLNPDVMISQGAVTALRAAADVFPRSFLFGPRMTNREGIADTPPRDPLFSRDNTLFKPLLHKSHDGVEIPHKHVRVGWIAGAAILARREAFLRLGGFDDKIFLFFDETDLCHRAVISGEPPVWVPDATVTNFHGSSSGQLTPSRIYFREWHFSWSQYYVARKYGHCSKFTDAMLRPAGLWLKSVFYRLTRKTKKVAYYAGRYDGAVASLRGRPANLSTSLWDAPPDAAIGSHRHTTQVE